MNLLVVLNFIGVYGYKLHVVCVCFFFTFGCHSCLFISKLIIIKYQVAPTIKATEQKKKQPGLKQLPQNNTSNITYSTLISEYLISEIQLSQFSLTMEQRSSLRSLKIPVPPEGDPRSLKIPVLQGCQSSDYKPHFRTTRPQAAAKEVSWCTHCAGVSEVFTQNNKVANILYPCSSILDEPQCQVLLWLRQKKELELLPEGHP